MLKSLQRIDWLQLIFMRYRWLSTLAALALCVLVGLAAGWVAATAGPFITAGLVVGVAGGLWMLRDIEVGYWALAGVICLLPFGKLPFDIGLKPSFLDLVLGTLFLVWLVDFVLSPTRGPRLARDAADVGGSQFVGTRLGAPIFIFLVLAVMSFVAGLAHAPLTQQLLRHFAEVILAMLLFFIVVNSVRRQERLVRLTRAIILAGFGAALVGIVLYYLPDNTSIDLLSALGRFDYPVGPGVLRYIREDPSLSQRATGTSVDPNVLGGLLIMIGALTVPQLFARRPIFDRRLVALIAAVMGLCLLLTFSRGSFVGLGAALLALAVLRYRKLIPLAAIGLLVLWFAPPTQDYVTHFVQGLQVEDLATQMRIGEYRDAVTLVQRYPVLGVGFAGSPDIDTYVSVAMVYLLIAVEMGLVGLAAFLLVVLVLFAEAFGVWRQLARDTQLEPIWYGYHAALLGALVGGIFDHYFFNLDFQHSVTLFWLFVGLAMVASRLARRATEPVDV